MCLRSAEEALILCFLSQRRWEYKERHGRSWLKHRLFLSFSLLKYLTGCSRHFPCTYVSGWMQDTERAHWTEAFPNLQTLNFLNHHGKAERNLAGEQGADCQERAQSSIFPSTIPVMNWKDWVELKSRFPAFFTKVPFQPALPQFYNVLEFTFTCLLTILQYTERF